MATPSCSTPNENKLARPINSAGSDSEATAQALLVASIFAVLELLWVFRLDQVRWIQNQTWFQWLDTPIVWCRLVGAILLWGRWDQKSWQRRTSLLLALCLADVVLWFVARGEMLGLHGGDVGHEWLRLIIGHR